MNIKVFKERLFQQGRELGFHDMEIYYQENKKFSSNVYKQEVDNYSIAMSGGLSFRGVYQGKMGYSYTEKLDEEAIGMLLEEAKSNSMILETQNQEVIFEGSSSYQQVKLFDEALEKVTPKEKIDLIMALEEEAYKLDKRLVSIGDCSIDTYLSERLIANTKGLERQEKSNIAAIALEVIVKEEEDTKTAFEVLFTNDIKNVEVKELAEKVVNEALSYLGATPVESKEYPILLKNKAMASLISAFTGAFSAENAQNGQSLLKDKVGQEIANPILTIIDNPFLEQGMQSRSFDSEGVATKELEVIKDGVLQTLLHNIKTAAKAGVQSTGHASKNSYKGNLTVAPSNIYVKNGENSFDELVASIEEGVMITELQGIHSGANAVSGDFSLAAHGYLIKDGKIARPVNQITIAGNFYQLLKDIDSIANDLAFSLPMFGGYVGSPTVKVKSLAVAGN